MAKLRFLIGGVLFVILSVFSVCVAQGEGPVEKFVDKQIDRLQAGCKAELETYCKNVTAGEGRLGACLYAYNDKLSPQCETTFYSSVEAFQNAAQNLGAFASACQSDIQILCSNIAIGEGRVLDCLIKHKEKISPSCLDNVQKGGLDYGRPGLMN